MHAIERWLAAANADADARGLPEMKPLLTGMAASTSVLRAAPWTERADAASASPMTGPPEGGRR